MERNNTPPPLLGGSYCLKLKKSFLFGVGVLLYDERNSFFFLQREIAGGGVSYPKSIARGGETRDI